MISIKRKNTATIRSVTIEAEEIKEIVKKAIIQAASFYDFQSMASRNRKSLSAWTQSEKVRPILRDDDNTMDIGTHTTFLMGNLSS